MSGTAILSFCQLSMISWSATKAILFFKKIYKLKYRNTETENLQTEIQKLEYFEKACELKL